LKDKKGHIKGTARYTAIIRTTCIGRTRKNGLFY